MVDVKAVRDILSKIRKVVTGDIILPEDHNYQTDAIAKLTDIVETISPGGAVEIPVIFPFPGPCYEGGRESLERYFPPFMPFRSHRYYPELWIMPFSVKLKKWFFAVTYNEFEGTAYFKLLDNDNVIASVTIPPGYLGTYSIQLNDYLLQEGHTFVSLLYPTYREDGWRRELYTDSFWVLGVIV
jgi:hypothetical protein